MRNPLRTAEFLRDDRGSITVEFVIWFPFLMLWFVGTVIFFDAFRVRNDAAKAAYTMADIASRYDEIYDTDLAELFALQNNLLPRAQTEGKWMRLSSIQNVGGNLQVLWSDPIVPPDLEIGEDYPSLATEDIPTELMPAMAELDTVILLELFVPYVPIASWVGILPRTWNIELVSRPRFVSSIARLCGPDPEDPVAEGSAVVGCGDDPIPPDAGETGDEGL